MTPSPSSRPRLGLRTSQRVLCRPKPLLLRAVLGACLTVRWVQAADAPSPNPPATPTPDATILPARTVRTQPSPEACVDAHERAVDHADTQRLLEARDEFAVCVSSTCPRVIREECASELSRLRSRIPSVVFVAKNEAGRDVSDVTVTLGGAPLLRVLTSRSIPLNPGRYEFQLTAANGASMTEAILLREGEQQRRVEVQFPGATPLAAAPPSTPEPEIRSPWTAPVLVSTMLGTLGFVSFGYFALAGTAVESCSPECSAEEVSALRLDYAIADVSLLVGLAGLTAAVVLYDAPEQAGPATTVSVRREGGLALDATWRF